MDKEKKVAKLVASYATLDYNQKKVTKDLFSNEIKKILNEDSSTTENDEEEKER